MEKILRRRFGVVPDIDMEKGTAILVFRAPTHLDFAGFAEAMDKSSHRLRSVSVEVSGRFEGSAERPEFAVSGTEQRLSAENVPRPNPEGRVRVRARVDRWDKPVLKVIETQPLP